MPTFTWIIATHICPTDTKYLIYSDGTVVIGAFFPILHNSLVRTTTDWKYFPMDSDNYFG
jgi:vomeronasal 2 receptor